MKKVLFVCTGNTCRSPMAEALFREAVKGRDGVEVASAGVSAWPGQSASQETLAILQQRGLDLAGHKSQPVSRELLKEADFVFAMTSGHLALLVDEFPEYESKAYLAGEFTDVEGMGIGADIPDPFGMGASAYQEVARVLDEVMPSLVAIVTQS